MAETAKKKPAAKAAAKTEKAEAAEATWKPTAEAKKKATTFRVIAFILWIVAIAGEAVGIFWLLRQRELVSGSEGEGLRRDPETGLLTEASDAVYEFPQWAFISLIVLLVVIAALSIIGSILWKKANRLDPASKKDTVRFFVQNQLGAIIAIIAFVPLIILVFLNKDMSGAQKGIAGGLGIVLVLVAGYIGVDTNPASVEKYTADQSAVIQLLGQDKVYWVEGGSVYHVCNDVSDIQNASSAPGEGTTAQAVAEGKQRLTLELKSELTACGLPVPENVSEITDALRTIQGGEEATPLPQPVYAEGVTPPFTPAG